MHRLLISLVFIVGCGLISSSPENVAKNFWQAVSDGKIEKAEELATKSSLRRLERMADRLELSDVQVEDAVVTENAAEVETSFEADGEPVVFSTHLVKTEDGWRVDPRRSRQSMNAALVEASVADLRDAFRAGAGALGEAMEEGLEEATEAMREALEELERPGEQP